MDAANALNAFAIQYPVLNKDLEVLKMAIVCPECDNPLDIDVDAVDEGETLTCDECGTELEIVSIEPLEVAPVDAEGYDDEDLTRDDDEEKED